MTKSQAVEVCRIAFYGNVYSLATYRHYCKNWVTDKDEPRVAPKKFKTDRDRQASWAKEYSRTDDW